MSPASRPRRQGERCNENKKLAGSIASPANEIVACRYTIRKRGGLAPAAAAPGCTATRASYAPPQKPSPTPQPPHPIRCRTGTATDAAAAASATTASAEATTAASGASAAAATATTASARELHAASDVFVVEEMEGGEADVGKFFFTERNHLARCKIRPSVEGRLSVPPMPMRLPLAKKSARRRPAPVRRLSLLASFSKLASPAAWSHPPTLQEGSPWR